MDFSNSVILPRQDFAELDEAAWHHPPASFGERSASVAQTFVVCVILSAGVIATRWGWAKVADWQEQKSFERAQADPNFKRSTF